MRYLIDTCVISELIKPRPSGAVTAWILSAEEQHLFLSVLTIGELVKGIAKLTDAERKARLESWVYEVMTVRFRERLLPISEDVARRWGAISGEAEQLGLRLPVIDSLLAATAMVHELTVVTRDVDVFERAGASLFNPWR